MRGRRILRRESAVARGRVTLSRMSILQPIYNTYAACVSLNRMRRIVSVLVKHGLGVFFEGRAWWFPFRRHSVAAEQQGLAQRVREALIELGPTFVKLGQMLSARPDLVGTDFASELSQLQNDVPAVPFEQVRACLERELGGAIGNVFQEFEETPVAAASVAQGYRAVLKDGARVFVKVLRPGIRPEIVADIRVLKALANYVHRNFPELHYLMLPQVAEQFGESLMEELDLDNERGNVKRFARQFAGREGLKVPRVWDEFSTKQVLVMEWMEGIKADDLAALKRAGHDLKQLASLGAELALEQYFQHGFFHADPHPGNMFILPGPRVCYIDFGLCGRLTQVERGIFCRMLMSILAHDDRRVARHLLQLTIYNQTPDLSALERAVGELIDRYFFNALEDIDVGGAILNLYELCNRFHLALKPHVYLLLKSMGLADGLGRQLDPKFSLEQHLRPFVEKVIRERLAPFQGWQKWLDELLDLRDGAAELPEGLRRFGQAVLAGELGFRLKVEGAEERAKRHRRSLDRCAVAVLAAGAVLAGALLLAAGEKVAGWCFLACGGALALEVLHSLWRAGGRPDD